MLQDKFVSKFVTSLNIIDRSPTFIWNKMKEEFFKFTFNSKVFYNSWENLDFDGKIVETLQWYQGDSLENYLEYGNRDYENQTIFYEMNEYGFRTSSKTNEIKKDKNIACFGCSQTLGEGLHFEETWPYALNEMLGNEWNVKNYGWGAASNDMIARLVYNYTLKNKPNFICILFSEVMRMEMFSDKNEIFNNCLPTEKSNFICEWTNDYISIDSEENGIYNFIKNFKFIDSICKSKNIPWYWSTWSIPIIFSPDEFKKRILNIDNYCKLNDDVESYLDVARDGEHFGRKSCKEIAKGFFDKISNFSQ
jgi:hypothetical protein